MGKFLIAFAFFTSTLVISQAQTELYAGTWRQQVITSTGAALVSLELTIASPEHHILYPAQLIIRFNDFSATYELLLVKKNMWQVAMSKNKYATVSPSFPVGEITNFLNGVLEYSKDYGGLPALTLKRIQNKHPVLIADSLKLEPKQKKTAVDLWDFFANQEIRFLRVSALAWENKNRQRVLDPALSPVYFGLMDTLQLQSKAGSLTLSGYKKSGSDIISVALNGRTFVEQREVLKKNYTEDLLLDTGLNIIALFADNFGNDAPNKGKLSLEFDDQKINLDFNTSPDSAAAFIVSRLYYNPGKTMEYRFQNFDSRKEMLKQDEKLTGSIVVNSQKLNLAIWDDATEDGDTISIHIDGKWLVNRFPVKKTPQFISVTLKPGPNVITFIADNVGSIPPNTSVLEIIDGKKRKSYMMETSPGENNLVRIFYEVKANQQ